MGVGARRPTPFPSVPNPDRPPPRPRPRGPGRSPTSPPTGEPKPRTNANAFKDTAENKALAEAEAAGRLAELLDYEPPVSRLAKLRAESDAAKARGLKPTPCYRYPTMASVRTWIGIVTAYRCGTPVKLSRPHWDSRADHARRLARRADRLARLAAVAADLKRGAMPPDPLPLARAADAFGLSLRTLMKLAGPAVPVVGGATRNRHVLPRDLLAYLTRRFAA